MCAKLLSIRVSSTISRTSDTVGTECPSNCFVRRAITCELTFSTSFTLFIPAPTKAARIDADNLCVSKSSSCPSRFNTDFTEVINSQTASEIADVSTDSTVVFERNSDIGRVCLSGGAGSAIGGKN